MVNPLNVVPRAQAWCIYGPCMNDPEMFSRPEEALATLILSPSKWPEDVNFYLQLARDGGYDHPALGYHPRRRKRPEFHNIGLCRGCRDHRPVYQLIDFWFLGKFLEALDFAGYRYLIVADDERDASIYSGSLRDFPPDVIIHRRSDWKKNWPLIRSDSALRFLGLEAVNRRHPESKRFWQRVGHRDWSPFNRVAS